MKNRQIVLDLSFEAGDLIMMNKWPHWHGKVNRIEVHFRGDKPLISYYARMDTPGQVSRYLRADEMTLSRSSEEESERIANESTRVFTAEQEQIIAAAPEMYEALKVALQEAESAEEDLRPFGKRERQIIRDALAKADVI